jgi:predicted amidohydrolase
MTAKNVLKAAFLHLLVERGRPDRNLSALMGLAREAANLGAKLLVAPEMALSGYCFENRESLLPFATEEKSPAMAALRDLAEELKVYLAVGLAEVAEPAKTLYNSAFLIGDKGQIVGKARKINAESRWARPGDQIQDNVLPTPWGRAGLLICADSWHSLLPRTVAAKGADFLILPANWPPSGLDPKILWSFRARENGLWLLACNRTGVESNLDCSEAASCAFDPYGQEIVAEKSEKSLVIPFELPLNGDGRLDSSRRREIMGKRDPGRYHRLYGNFSGLKFLTSFLKLPEPGPLALIALAPGEGLGPLEFLREYYGVGPGAAPEGEREKDDDSQFPEGLFFWPQGLSGPEDAEILNQALAKRAAISRDASGNWLFYGRIKGERVSGGADGLYLTDYEPLRIWLAEPEEILSPEAAVAAAKWGTDLAVAFVPALTPQWRRLASLRPIEQMAVAVVAPDGAAMGLPWQGHDAGRGAYVGVGEAGGLTVDASETREKRFQDRLDFEALFRPSVL